MAQAIIILVVFLALAALMVTRKIPTFFAMILLAILTVIIAGVPVVAKNEDGANIGWLHTIIEAGSTRMASAYIAVIFGGWLGTMMNYSGVTQTIIKKSAELGGDRKLIVTLILSVVIALLFTTLAGLGSVIMVGSIVLPILISVGVPALTAGAVLLMSFNVGLTFNMANWQTFSGIFGLEIPEIQGFMTWMLPTTAIATLAFILIQHKRDGRKFAFSAPVNPEPEEEVNEDTRPIKGVLGILAIISPLIPILLVVIFSLPVIPAFLAGILWLAIFTAKSFSKTMNMLTKTFFDGIKNVAPAVLLMICLGMLFLAVTHPSVKEVLNPFLTRVVPSNRILFIIFFALLAPFSLYRGPMNLFGFGSGIAALIIGLGTLSPHAVMGAFISAERIQGAGCPTNTQNVWTAAFTKTDVNSITIMVLPYLWAVSIVGVILSSILYF